MKIAQLTSNFHTVSPTSTHAMYSLAASLVNGLIDLGNEVTLYGAGDSKTNGKLFSVSPGSIYNEPEDTKRHQMMLLVSKCYQNAHNYDIIHSHFTLVSSFFANLVSVPTLISVHSPIEDRLKPFLSLYNKNNYVSFSLAQRKQMPDLNWVANIYHGVDPNIFTYNDAPQDYFFYLGRITEEKGVHLAIEAAKAAGVKLIIAGASYQKEGYWHERIEKNIDGKNVSYIGEANLETKIEYLRNAKGLLFPTQYDEVFGMVMIEAMSCGTPVIAWDKGSVPEVIQDKVTGYVVNSVDKMVQAINSIDKISRQACRDRAERYFSIEKMVQGYERVYLRVIEEHRAKMRAKQKAQS